MVFIVQRLGYLLVKHGMRFRDPLDTPISSAALTFKWHFHFVLVVQSEGRNRAKVEITARIRARAPFPFRGSNRLRPPSSKRYECRCKSCRKDHFALVSADASNVVACNWKLCGFNSCQGRHFAFVTSLSSNQIRPGFPKPENTEHSRAGEPIWRVNSQGL